MNGSNATTHRPLPLLSHETLGPAGAPWVTFVPGIGNDRGFWADQAARLAGSYRVLLFDPWGHGESPPPPENCHFNDMVAGLIALWDHVGVARSALVGLGFGGSLAIATALANPDRVSAVVACCCRPRLPDDRRVFWRDRRAQAGEIGMERIADITVDRWLSEDFRVANPAVDEHLRAAMRRTSLPGYRAYVDAFIEMDFTARFGELACPMLLIAAELDHGGGPVSAMTEMAELIPGACLAVLPGVGHICVAEAPDALHEVITPFLESLSDRPGGAFSETNNSNQSW